MSWSWGSGWRWESCWRGLSRRRIQRERRLRAPARPPGRSVRNGVMACSESSSARVLYRLASTG
ncbi:hypothetical protein CQ037_19325 [Microbacterium sp. MYb50]|nr:hypothetical protein CQ032_19595 [Microbacterium sp. MYb43]PRB21294.1 hypothetical protein CQ037_19325 [Microbacterium sp. MYb50]PRB69933.1 hypothetical protein CQ021_04255 [Microbacterium sp. MYb24]